MRDIIIGIGGSMAVLIALTAIISGENPHAVRDKQLATTCKLVERNRPNDGRTYNVYKCGDVIEWVRATK